MSSAVDSVSLYKIRKLLTELSTKEGRGTELVTLYVPAKKALHEVISTLREEWGTAGNIKSDTTKVHVQDSLTKTMQRLKLYKKTPENGVALFCGALPTNGLGSEEVRIFEIHPHKPIQTFLYRCDDHFHLDILKNMLKEEKTIGILSVDSSEAGLGIISGERLEVAEVLTSGISGKHRAGGQSARRFERLRDMELTQFYHRVADHATKVFLEENKISGLIVSGPGPTKDEFLKTDLLHYQLRNMIKATIDAAYSGAEGVRETLQKAGDVVEDMRIIEERKFIQRFLREVNSKESMVVYGIAPVVKAIERANIQTVLVSDDTGMIYIRGTCRKCKDVYGNMVSVAKKTDEKQNLLVRPCANGGHTDWEIREIDLVEYLEDKIRETGAQLEVMSSRTEEGIIFKSFSGIAGFLRYKQ